MFRFLQSLFVTTVPNSGKFPDTLIHAAIERVVDGTDPRLRAVSDYRKKLWEPVEHALDYTMTLVETLPPPLNVKRRNFSMDPKLRAFFISPDHLQQTVSFSQGIRIYLRQASGNALPKDLYAVMGMECYEKNVLGMALEGDLIHHSVPQVTVNFCNHGVAFPAANMQDTQSELKKRAFDHLIKTALQQLLSTRLQRKQLEQQRLLLQQKAKNLQAGKVGLDPLMGPTPQNAHDFAALEQRIRAIEMELANIRADSTTLEHHLARIVATLSAPEQHLRLQHNALRLDHMNCKVPENANRPANNVNFQEASLGDGRKLAIMFIRFPSDEILMPPDPFEEARRFLM